MAEVRVTHLAVVVVVAGVVAFLVLSCGVGSIAVGPFNKETTDHYLSSFMGFPPAKTPAEAMDKFREAIQARKYTTAARYCTKPYKELLERANPGASDMGSVLDKIHGYAKDNGYVTDKLTVAMYQLDPFPRNFTSGKPPEVKGDKAYGRYKWEPLPVKGQVNVAELLLDPGMYNVYAPSVVFSGVLELVKEGEDWKLNIPVNQVWETQVGYFNDNYKRYHNGLTSFKGDMLNNRFPGAQDFEMEVLKAIKNAKQQSRTDAMHQDKRQQRKLKREIKQAGNKKRRHQLKNDLRDNPEEAHLTEPTVGKKSSETLNGLDKDATRQREQES